MKNLLETHNVVKKFGDFTALNGISISVPENSIYGLLGPNGAGKTTLIRIINQITMPDTGKVLFNGRELQPDDVHLIGYLPEERGLYKNMKVGEQAIYLAMLKGMTKQDAKKALKYWFEKFGITSWWNKKLQELSKGQAQKVQFIITVMHNPKLLIFDEVFSGFDPINANLIRDEILELRKKGATIIFSTHRMESVEELCDDIALINKGEKILEGNLIEIKKQFKSNTFEIGLKTNNKNEIKQELASKYQVREANFKTLEDELKLLVKVPDDDPKELINYLNNKGILNHFVELIPSANDIFIEAVNKHS
ncbi:MAG TPA: ATP-binding cassette domain-containing protein [Flavobacteriia bacterium]|nr:ATP-binding cassette domain-containing protein [Flavobacteriia bacterium]